MTSLEHVAARTWASRAHQEGDAARAFARIARSLRCDDAPEPLVAAASDSSAQEVRHAVADTVPDRVFEPEPHPTLAAELEHLGCLSRATIADLFQQTLTSVVLPGLEESGIETAQARRWLDHQYASGA